MKSLKHFSGGDVHYNGYSFVGRGYFVEQLQYLGGDFIVSTATVTVVVCCINVRYGEVTVVFSALH